MLAGIGSSAKPRELGRARHSLVLGNSAQSSHVSVMKAYFLARRGMIMFPATLSPELAASIGPIDCREDRLGSLDTKSSTFRVEVVGK